MNVKSQQVSKPSMAKREQAIPGVRNRVRGFPGNHTITRSLNPAEELARQPVKQGANSAGVPVGVPAKIPAGVPARVARDRTRSGRVREGKQLQRQRTSEADLFASAQGGVSGAGLPLPDGPRDFLERQFGSHFGDVRLHTGPRAAGAARKLGAAAYTLGRDIAFAEGFYAPDTGRGLGLLSHELAHVVQWQNARPALLQAGETNTARASLEHDAERAVGNFGRGRPIVQERLNRQMPLCHPVYMSAHGDQKYLDEAAAFYADWGNATVKRGVDSIEDLVKELAGQGAIDHITIVSHANPRFIRMRFVNGGPDQVLKSDWAVDSTAMVVNLEKHLVDANTVNTIIQSVQNTNVISLIGQVSNPIVRQFIWWLVDLDHVRRAGYTAESATMIQTATDRKNVYRNQLLGAQAQPSGSGSGSGGGSGSGSQGAGVTNAALDAVEKAVLAEAKRYKWSPGAGSPLDYSNQLKDSPSAEVVRILQKPDFFSNLGKVRSNITSSSWIEIQGCNAGADKDYLVGAQKFFGGSAKPKVTAPDWYQTFGHYGVIHVNTHAVVKEQKAAKAKDKTVTVESDVEAQWKTPGVPESLAFWYPLITGKSFPKKRNYVTLQKYLEAGHVLPLAHPGSTAPARMLAWHHMGEKAFLEWLAKHDYQIKTQPEIKKKFFTRKAVSENVTAIHVDWLTKDLIDPTEAVFRPQKEYEQHIIKVP
jgi:hypothetical protein